MDTSYNFRYDPSQVDPGFHALFATLEAHGIQCCLISAQAIKHVPGRKSDVLDCPWRQTLHSSGLLRAIVLTGRQKVAMALGEPVLGPLSLGDEDIYPLHSRPL